MADVSPTTLMAQAACYACVPPGMRSLLEISLLAQISSTGGGGGGGGGTGLAGVGSPEGVQTASPGTTYLDTNSGAFYAKQTGVGNTGWLVLVLTWILMLSLFLHPSRSNAQPPVLRTAWTTNALAKGGIGVNDLFTNANFYPTIPGLTTFVANGVASFTSDLLIAGNITAPGVLLPSIFVTTGVLRNTGGTQVFSWDPKVVFDGSSVSNVQAATLSTDLTNYINNLVANLNRDFYFSSVTQAVSSSGVITNCFTMIDSPVQAATTNSIAIPNAGVYFLSRISTNTVSRIEEGPVQLQTFIYITGGGGVQTVTAHPEIYLWTTNDAITQLGTSGPQLFTEGANPISYITTINLSVATNCPPGSRIVLRWFADAVANTPTWNFVIGGVYQSHISVNVANQSGTYIGDFIGDGGGLSNLQSSAIFYGTNRWAGPTNTLTLNNNYQLFVSSGNCAVTNLTGLSATASTYAMLWISNSAAVSSTNTFSIPGANIFGPNSTNSLVLPSGKMGLLSVSAYGTSFTNLATMAQQ